MIKHEGEKWILYTKDGSRKLGEHDTENDAKKQESAIEANRHAEARYLHLRGALGAVRTEQYEGREHLVVPVVALMEGVIHAVNAATPERVTAATLSKAAASWNGRPLVLGHPVKNGRQCSANEPEIIASHGFGTVFNSRVAGTKLLMDAYVDPTKAEKVGGAGFLKDLREGKMCEVSVGAFVTTDPTPGELNGKPYKATWLDTVGDHLAFLPAGRGACSIDMGCGAHRAAMHLVTAEAIEPQMIDVQTTVMISALEGESLDERMRAVYKAVEKRWQSGAQISSISYAYAQQIFDDHVIVRGGDGDDDLYSVPYTIADGEVTLGMPTKVKMTYVAAAAYEDCPVCKGTGNVNGNPCETCDGNGELRVALGARHSSGDQTMIQGVHDHAVALGAVCDRMAAAAEAPQLTAACGCGGESTMTKEKKAELIAALVTNKHSGFKVGDEPFLETASDARLEEFRTAAEARTADADAKVKLETDQLNTTARLKVAEDKVKVLEDKQQTEDEFLASPAGATLRTLVADKKAQDAAEREGLIKTLKTVGKNTEDELKAMDMGQLRMLASYAKVQVQDFSGRGLPAPRNAEGDEDYTPPDPYAEPLKALRASGSKAVN